MKKIIVELALVLVYAATAIAQDGFSYQAVVRNADGTLVSNANVGMRFTLFDGTQKCYQETQTVSTNANGVVSVVIGGKSSNVKAGSFAQVPWKSMKVMMEVEADINGGGSYISYGKTQIQAVPYSLYAASAPATTEIVASADAADDQELFSVKNQDGNVVFAVYPSGVKVYVDADSSKTMKHGFVVSGLKATKDGYNDLLVIDETGTRVFVDADENKTMKHGFAVSGLKATKEEGVDNIFIVDADGTQVFVDNDNSKTMKHGFAVSGLKATKEAGNNLLTIDGTGTRVYVGTDESKTMKHGFAVSGLKATKEAGVDTIFTVDADGTRVFIDNDSSKTMKHGFAVSGLKATKGVNNNLLTIDETGTRVYVDAEDGKTMKHGFAVSGLKATKEEGVDNIFIVDADGTQVFIDDYDSKTMKHGFAVSGLKATKDNPFNSDYLFISDTMTIIGVKGSNENSSLTFKDMYSGDTMAFVSQNVFNIMNPLRVLGDIDYRDYIDSDTLHYALEVPCSGHATEYYGKIENADLFALLKLDCDSNDGWFELSDGQEQLFNEYANGTLRLGLKEFTVMGEVYISGENSRIDDSVMLLFHHGFDIIPVSLDIHCYPELSRK